MPPKNCGSCSKMVYPMDELKCLDKVWHKSCFKCQTCSMTLNMKNYKGYSKLPYCNAHYPTTKFTSVAETPEIRRIAKNTKIQSNIKYHAEFEAAKGQYTAVADDPETLRVRKNMETISNIAYHGDMMRKQEMESARPSEIESSSSQPEPVPTPIAAVRREPAAPKKMGSISDYDPINDNRTREFSSQPQSSTVFSTGHQAPRSNSPPAPVQVPVSSQPAPSFPPPVAAQRAPSPPPVEPEPEPVFEEPQPEPVAPEPTPVEAPEPTPVEAPEPISTTDSKGQMSKALYDYTAADEDEVTFVEDDIIINCEAIDEGWMNGTVERTGLSGMLPSNYVEPINW